MTTDLLLAPEHHGHGLAEDLQRIEDRLLKRRRALAWLGASAGTVLLDACGGGSSGDASALAGTSTSTTATSATTTAATTTAATTTSSSSSSTSTSSSSGSTTGTTTSSSTTSCIADPQETSGPYPADGTNTSSGSTSDVLTASGIVRSDIRSSFIGSSTVADGVQLALTLTLVDSSASCTPLAGYAIYVWHCDAGGDYSLYTAPAESYLRGVQVTDSAGQVTFTTIFPACYSGRWPHIHIEVFADQAAATSGRNALLTTQLAMPSAVCNTVYQGSSLYRQSINNLATVSIATDLVFGDDTSAQIAAMTPAMTGSVADGYAATATIGMAV